jgi:hypothetical protein
MRVVMMSVVTLTVVGCYQPAYVSPEPLTAGDYCGSLALTGQTDDIFGFGASGMLQGRVGFGGGFDAGIRLSFPGEIWARIPLELYGDVKWNFLSSPYLFTADVGCSYYHTVEGDLSEHFISDTVSLALWPSLLVGSRTCYGGPRLMIRRGSGMELGHAPPNWVYAGGVLLGASLGNRFRVMPQAEFSWVLGGGSTISLGVNLEVHALDREANEADWLR